MIFISELDRVLNYSNTTFHSLCVRRDFSEGLVIDLEEDPKKIYELIIPSSPTVSVIGLLKKNKKLIDQILGSKDYVIKFRSFPYFFSQMYFNDYPYKEGTKSFLSIMTREIGIDSDKLAVELKIVVIGKPAGIVEEEIELYLYQKLIDLNKNSIQVKVSSCSFAFKADPFNLPGEAEPAYSLLNLTTTEYNFDVDG